MACPSWCTPSAVWAKVAPNLIFAAPKFVVIRDWRLGLTLKCFQLAVLIYVLVDLIQRASYLQTEVPKGIITPVANVDPGIRTNLFTQFAGLDRASAIATTADRLPYCGPEGFNASYNFEWNNETFSNISCTLVDLPSLNTKGESEYFFATYMEINKFMWIRNLPNGSCPTEAEFNTSDIPAGSTPISDGDGGACLYENVQHYFPIETELTSLGFLHSYQTSSLIDKNGVLPKVYIRSPNYKDDEGDFITFDEGQRVELTLQQWLDMAGVNLDHPLNDQPNRHNQAQDADKDVQGSGEFVNKFPLARLSGVELVLTLNYYMRQTNREDEFNKATGKDADKIFCVIDVEPRFQWTTEGSNTQYMLNSPRDPIFLLSGSTDEQRVDDNVILSSAAFQRNGIRFTFRFQGLLGRFSATALVQALVSGSVLLSIAQTIVTFVALYGLGLSSKLYMEFMRESCEWRKEYARFAAQALVAGYAFMGYDTSNNGKLDRTEVYKTLQRVVGNRLAKEKVASLADFLMRHSEEDDKVLKGAFTLEDYKPKNNSINIEEWVEIFTEDKVQFESLERLMDQEYPEKRTRDVLMRLAEGEKPQAVMEDLKDGILGNEDEDSETVPPRQGLMEGHKEGGDMTSSKDPDAQDGDSKV